MRGGAGLFVGGAGLFVVVMLRVQGHRGLMLEGEEHLERPVPPRTHKGAPLVAFSLGWLYFSLTGFTLVSLALL